MRRELSCSEITERLEAAADPAHREKMARFGITADHPFGVPVTVQKAIARECVKSLPLAKELWDTGRHEARMMASMLAPPSAFTSAMMDEWTESFASWDICDGCCFNLFRYTPYVWDKIPEYARREEEYVRRTAFALIAGLAIGDKKAPDEKFLPFLPLIEEYSADNRNFVRKAVNWALRQIGKRSLTLHEKAMEVSLGLASRPDKSARWIGSDAVRELSDPKITARIKR